MTTTDLSLSLASYGSLSGRIYHASASSENNPAKLVVLLHGWGADGADLLPLAPLLAARGSGDGVFVPDAPYVCSANPFGRQWFELSDPATGLGRNAAACQNAASLIAQMLDSLSSETGFAAEQIVLGGFSQGGMVSLTGGLAYTRPLRGLFCLSGAWLTPDQTLSQPASLPVFLGHGGADPVVPADCMVQAEAALQSAGFAVQTLLREGMVHGIDQATIDRLAEFLSGL